MEELKRELLFRKKQIIDYSGIKDQNVSINDRLTAYCGITGFVVLIYEVIGFSDVTLFIYTDNYVKVECDISCVQYLESYLEDIISIIDEA